MLLLEDATVSPLLLRQTVNGRLVCTNRPFTSILYLRLAHELAYVVVVVILDAGTVTAGSPQPRPRSRGRLSPCLLTGVREESSSILHSTHATVVVSIGCTMC